MVPESDLQIIRAWCQAQVPPEMQDRIRVEADVAQNHVTIVEIYPDGQFDFDSAPRDSVARLRYVKYARLWTLYWCDRNSKFHEYHGLDPAEDVQVVLDFLDSHEDPIFWG